MKKNIILWLLIFMITGLTAQDNKKVIAVLDLDPTGITESDAQFLSDRLRAELFETGVFTVVEREKMNEILTEQGFQSSGCTSVDCAVEIGRLLNVQQIVAGNIGKIDELFSIGLRLIDIQSGAIVKTATRDYEGKLSDVLVEVIPEVAEILAAKEFELMESAVDTTASISGKNFAAVLKYGWAFLTYVDDLNNEIDKFAASGNEVRLENFTHHLAFTIEGKYIISDEWGLKIGITLENMRSSWLNEFNRFQSEIPEIKNLTDISLERKFSFAHIYLGMDYIIWQPSAEQEWYVGADIGNIAMESYLRYAYKQDLSPMMEESISEYSTFALRLSVGFKYRLINAFYLGLEVTAQAASKFDLSSEQTPENFPVELEPVVFPKEISASGIILQITGAYRF